jgi:aspartate/methionine/tyrosine aminotransferase
MASLFLTKLLIRTGLARFLPRVRRLGRGAAGFLHYYSDRVLAAPQAALAEAARCLEIAEPDGIDLALGSPRTDLVPSASTWLPADRRGPPPPGGLLELRAAVAARLAGEQQLSVDPTTDVLVTAGAAGALSVVLDTFVNPGDRVVLFDPTSLLYPLVLRQHRARIRWVPTELEAGRICFPFDRLARALHGARLLILANPASPTGGIFPAESLEQLAWWAERHDVLLFNDLAFARYQYEGEPCSLGALPQAWKRTLTAGSASKDYALASARVGWLAGHRHLVGACAMTAALEGQLVPTLCQQLACTALRQDGQACAALVAELAARRRYVFDRLQALGVQASWPAGAFFIWVGAGHLGLSGAAFAERLLREKKVLVWPGSFFGPSGSGHVRLSYLTEEGRLREGLARLGELVRQVRGNEQHSAAPGQAA